MNTIIRGIRLFRTGLPLAICLSLALPAGLLASVNIRIDSVSPEYTPNAGVRVPEVVSLESYAFEVNEETSRARVAVEYTYPNKAVFGLEGGAGPQPTLVQLPSLIYDTAANAVVYVQDGKRTTCATVERGKFLWWKTSKVKSTGACIVTAQKVAHAEDDGWRIRRSGAVDVYFDVR